MVTPRSNTKHSFVAHSFPRAQPLDRIILGNSCYGFCCQRYCLQTLLPRAWYFLCVSESEGWGVIRPNEVEKAAAVSLVAQEVRTCPFFPEWGVPDRSGGTSG